ncbi:histidine triad nucleotide-binding protein [Patescibacteria group bacterium]|nr:histidine triad nucleotide-binding protein [Patescibacteria group bacterium]
MDCIFCKIIAGDIPGQVVHETDQVLVLKDINPKAPVHDLIIPKEHITNLNELDDKEMAAELLTVVKDVAKKEGIDEGGYRLIVNTGKNGGQLVPHLHFHLLGGKNLGPKIVID